MVSTQTKIRKHKNTLGPGDIKSSISMSSQFLYHLSWIFVKLNNLNYNSLKSLIKESNFQALIIIPFLLAFEDGFSWYFTKILNWPHFEFLAAQIWLNKNMLASYEKVTIQFLLTGAQKTGNLQKLPEEKGEKSHRFSFKLKYIN